MIRQGAARLSLGLEADQVAKAEAYLGLLKKWNQVAGLTGIDEPRMAVGLHLMDSFAVHPYIQGQAVCDVGSGAGLPGLPLAILFPHKDFILVDSNARKTHFMTQACLELQLANVQVLHQRAEAATGSFAHVISRAYASLNKIVSTTGHLAAPAGNLLAMKGRAREPLDHPGYRMKTVHLKVPFVQASRRLCILEAANPEAANPETAEGDAP